MFQKYGSDPIRNLLVDKVDGAALAYEKAVALLKEHDDVVDVARPGVDFSLVPDRAVGYLKHDVLDILVQWSAGEIGAGVAYERIVIRAAEDTP